jgi:sigma-B regulation protein RsbU (phosphoserine phosphatase)
VAPELLDTRRRLRVLNELLERLNRAADVRAVLGQVLQQLVEALGLASGWIILRDPSAQDPVAGRGFLLAGHYNLFPALGLDQQTLWEQPCACEVRAVSDAYNEAACPRMEQLRRDVGGTPMHASAPLWCDGRHVGVLNVASADWQPLDDAALAFLGRVARELGRAVDRSRVLEQLQARRLDEQDALLDLSRRLLGHGSLDALVMPLLESAIRVLGADACALLLPDDQGPHLRFRAAMGWRADPVAAGRAALADDSCSVWQSMQAGQPVVIEDLAAMAAHTWAVPWVQSEGFRGHIVAPLVADGLPIGALVVNTREPRLFSEQEQRFTHLLANTAALAIESARMRAEAAKRSLFERELGMARDIQGALLPDSQREIEGWEVASAYTAAETVGGDFFDMLPLRGPNRRYAFVIGDVSGKSISGALLMALSLSAIREAIRGNDDPVTVLRAVNRRVVRGTQDDRFVTALYGVFEAESGRLQYASAGHNAPLLVSAASGRIRELPIQGVALGVLEDARLEAFEARLEPGDMLVLFTDGITEGRSAEGDMFGEERLREAILAVHRQGAAAVKREILDRLALFTYGTAPSDDVTLLILQRRFA